MLPKDPEKHQEYRDKLSKANKGKPRSEETKLKLSQKLQGRTLSIEHKLKISEVAKANGHGKWMKGKPRSEETKLKIRQSQRARFEGIERGVDVNVLSRSCWEYTEWRTAVFERDDYTCQDCGQVGGKLNSHHISPWDEFPELRYVVSNGKTLCGNCHGRVHRKKKE